MASIASAASVKAFVHREGWAAAVLLLVGAVVALRATLTLVRGLYARLLRPGKHIVSTYGRWAVVTGATDGIGKAMAFELAKQGLSVLLISRSQDKLDATSKEISEKYAKVEVRTLSIDFSNFDEEGRASVAKAVEGMDVGVLINNVGISYPFTKYFHELDSSRVEQLMTLNVNSTTWMSYIVLPGMISRKRGAIVNIGSVAGVTVSPLLVEYGAAKSYVAMFSKALNVELEKFNIHVQCQVPFFVATKLAKLKKASLFVASPSQYARAAVAAIGFEDVVSPFWTHALQLWFLMSLPEYIGAKAVEWSHLGIRKAGMKKEERERAEANKDKKA